jgi:hypothetical protein
MAETFFSILDVQKHNTASDFWIILDNKIYDISTFSHSHPGGEIIYSCAGTDASILIAQYHFDRRARVDRILAKYMIGKLSDESPRSPIVGAFYKDLSERVASFMLKKNLFHHPTWPLVMLLFDIFVSIMLVLITMLIPHPKIPSICALVLIYGLEIFMGRSRSHAHAVGHMQVVDKRYVRLLELIMHVFSETSFIYALPGSAGNPRQRLSEARSIAQYEYPGRGPCEHQVLHHVKGTDYDHDACFKVASLNDHVLIRPGVPTMSRVAAFTTTVQRFEVGRFALSSISFFTISLLGLKAKALNILPHIRRGEYSRGFALSLGLGWTTLSIYCQFSVAWKASPLVLPILLVLRHVIGSWWLLFFAQHKWDAEISQLVADQDWGAAQVTTLLQEPFNTPHNLFGLRITL